MAIEIERKFLVKNQLFESQSSRSYSIEQGFLNSDKNRVVRVRLKDEQGFLTIKGKTNDSGLSRFEWEKEIDFKEAKDLLLLCEKNIIQKRRFEVVSGNHCFEIDVFSGLNEGLIIAEVELNSEEENFIKPSWLGTEVTGQPQYYNSELSKNPYLSWVK
jgi:CYTH domain-containing protein